MNIVLYFPQMPEFNNAQIVTLPGFSYENIGIQTKYLLEEFPAERPTFNPISITVTMDENYRLYRKILEKFTEIGYNIPISVYILIFVGDEIIECFELKNAFIDSVSDVSISSDSIPTIDVSISFERVNILDKPQSLNIKLEYETNRDIL